MKPMNVNTRFGYTERKQMHKHLNELLMHRRLKAQFTTFSKETQTEHQATAKTKEKDLYQYMELTEEEELENLLNDNLTPLLPMLTCEDSYIQDDNDNTDRHLNEDGEQSNKFETDLEPLVGTSYNEDNLISSPHQMETRDGPSTAVIFTSGGKWEESPSKRKLEVASSGTWEDRSPKTVKRDEETVAQKMPPVRRKLFPSKQPISSPQDIGLDLEDRDVGQLVGDNDDIKRKGRKKYFCIFCKKLVPHFPRHLLNNHMDKDEVRALASLPKQSANRKELLKELRGKGAIFYNTQQNTEKESLIVSRITKTVQKMHKPCPNCNNFYSKNSLYKHAKICTKQKSQGRKLQSDSSAVLIKYSFEGKASKKMLTDILPGMIQDEITQRVVEDQTIIEYGNYLCNKHAKEVHLTNHVRTKLRQIANILNILIEINPEITSLEEVFRPQHFDSFMESVRRASGFCPDDGTFRAPSLVIQVGAEMKTCAERLSIYAIKSENEDLKEKVDRWLEIFNHEYNSTLGKLALADLAQKKWNKPRLLPFTEDIMLLNNYLKKSVQEAEERLKENFDQQAFSNLNRGILLQILIFNRKRVGESERLLIEDFKRRHKIQKESEVYNSLSHSEKVVASRYTRVEIRGKKGRPVPILISHEQAKSIERMLSMRKEAGVADSNKFVFGRGPNNFYKAGQALRDAAISCGAKMPKLITGTSLRKEIATTSQALNFTDNDMAVLADFMGHNIETHRHFYRMPSEVMHLAKISQMLIALDEGKISQFHGKSLDEINVEVGLNLSGNTTPTNDPDNPDDPEDPDDPEEVNVAQTTHEETFEEEKKQDSKKNIKHKVDTQRHPKKSPTKSKKTRQKWRTPERHSARKVFSEYLKKGLVPSPSKCLQAIRMHPELKERTVSQLKAWVYYEIQRNNKRNT